MTITEKLAYFDALQDLSLIAVINVRPAIAALRIAEAALRCIVDGELPEDAESDQECWDQTADRALRKITEALNA